ncbi:MAG: hypothetical protein ACRD3W_15570, partial [Terriglobales bacterium]
MKTTKLLTLIAAIVPIALLCSCGARVDLSKSANEKDLSNPAVTRAVDEKLYPDDSPSSVDGKIVWQEQKCASCHSAGGKASAFTDVEKMRQKKPIDQFMF